MEHLSDLAEIRGELKEWRHLEDAHLHTAPEEEYGALRSGECLEEWEFAERPRHCIRLEYAFERGEDVTIDRLADRVPMEFWELRADRKERAVRFVQPYDDWRVKGVRGGGRSLAYRIGSTW